MKDSFEGKTAPAFEKWWFKAKHKTCLRCLGKCKQSDKVKIIACPQYKEK